MKILKYRLLPLGLLCAAGLQSAQAGFAPVPLEPGSYTHDMIVESNATPALRVVTTASVDNGIANTANTWMEAGFDPANPANGLPPAGTVVTAVSNANYSFKMPPSYTDANGILIDTVVSNGTFTLTTPATYALLSFLSSGGNGGDNIGVKVHHQDGTTETGSFGSPDWFGGTLNVAIIANERCGSTTEMTYANQNSSNPRLYFRDMTLTNTTSPVTSVDFYYLSGQASSHNDIVGMSGAKTTGGVVSPIDVTGYDYDFVVEASAPKRGLVTAADGITAATTATMDAGDNNTGNTWYEIGHNYNDCSSAGPINATNVLAQQIAQSTGLPHAGSLVTNATGDRVFQMPPDYTTNNACLLSSTITSNTITFASPTSASALSFLAAGGSGGGSPEIVAHHADGVLETNVITVPDWFNDSVPYVIAANGRVAADTANWDQTTNTSKNPRMFNVDVLLLQHTTSPITSVDLLNTNNFSGAVAIFSVSANPGPLAPIFVAQAQSVTTNNGATVRFTATATSDVSVSYQWQKATNGTFVNLVDGGNVSGSQTTTLTLANVGDADEASYRLVATDSAGTSTSSAATLVVLSPLQVVTVPGDPIVGIPNNGNEPAEGVEKAIDGTTTKYYTSALNSGSAKGTEAGFIVTPSMGRTIVTALQLVAANDSPERDPANSILEGSTDGGATWTLISSNVVAMPDARNNSGLVIDTNLFTLSMVQLKFPNSNGYALYRWTTSQLKNQPAANGMQIGEVRLLGVADTSGKPSVGLLPDIVKGYETTNASNPQTITVTATIAGSPAPSVQWQKNSGTGFVNVSNGGDISGATTATLTISPTGVSDAGNYRIVATNTAGAVTSSIVSVQILSTLPDVTQAGDSISDFGNQNTAFTTLPDNAIDDTTTKYENPGSGLNVHAGFPPFAGPVGLVMTPAAGSTIVTGLRIYTADANPERDPADYVLSGSNDGTNYVTIASGSLALPTERNASALQLDPITEAMQEVLFANNTSFTSYKLTFNNVRDDSSASELQFAELELLGVPGVSAGSPRLTFSFAPGSLSITSSVNGTLQSTTALDGANTVWTNEGSVNAGTAMQIPIDPTVPAKFYRVKTP